MKGILTRLEVSPQSGHLRTNAIEGDFMVIPVIGKSFEIYGESLTKLGEGTLGFRQVRTSTVQDVKQEEGKYIFKTLNSTYELQLTEESK
jgi:hypothetical protein